MSSSQRMSAKIRKPQTTRAYFMHAHADMEKEERAALWRSVNEDPSAYRPYALHALFYWFEARCRGTAAVRFLYIRKEPSGGSAKPRRLCFVVFDQLHTREIKDLRTVLVQLMESKGLRALSAASFDDVRRFVQRFIPPVQNIVADTDA